MTHQIPSTPRPWYRRWPAIAGASVLGAALVAGTASAATTAFSHPAQRPVAATVPAKPTPAVPAPTPKTVPAASAPAAPAPVAPAAPVINIYNTPPSSGYVYVPEYNAPSYVTANEATVQQYYAYLNAHDYQDAWNMGGNTLNGYTGYQAWVDGYATTSWITLGSTWQYYPNSNAIQVTITAGQFNGSVNTYTGYYTVSNGSITGANITQTS